MLDRPPRTRRRLAAACLSVLTFASAGMMAAQADSPKKEADLVLTKTASPSTSSVAVGGTVTYRIRVVNDGDDTPDHDDLPGTKVQIDDSAPDGIAFLSTDITDPSTGGDRCSTSAGKVHCDIRGNIRPDGVDFVEVQITAMVTHAPATGDQICNQATVSGNHPDRDMSNNTNDPDSACVTVNGSTPTHTADLSIKKTASADEVPADGSVTYTLTAENGDNDTAQDVVIEDQLPAGVAFDTFVVAPQGCTQADGLIKCSIESMAPSATVVVSYSVNLTKAEPGTTFCNNASIASFDPSESDPNPENNSDSKCVAVSPQANLSIVKTASRSTAIIGEPLVYTLKVHNAGPNDATGVVVTDTVARQATVTNVATTQGSCVTGTATAAGTPVTCALGSIDLDKGATVTITVAPNTKGMIDNTAGVTGNEVDPDTTDNTSTVSGTAYVALTGGAYGESVDVKTLIGVQVQSGPLASVSLPAGGGGPFSSSAASVRVTNGLFSDILRLDALNGTTQGGRAVNGDIYVKSSADVTKVSLANGLITLDAIHSQCLSTTGTGGGSGSNIANLRIAGVAVNVAAGANSTITVPGVGQLILNEQGSSGAGLNQSRFVNGLHLKLNGLLAHGDVILAHSDCGIDP